MTREELTNKFLESDSKNYILQLPTGYGKTLLSLKKTKQWLKNDDKILIAIPRLINKGDWIKEIHKWHLEDMLDKITFTTYISLPKCCDPNKRWNTLILDEGHHTSPRCREALQYMNVSYVLVLSATLKRDLLYYFNTKYHPEIYNIRMKDAIENEVLPDPRVILIEMNLDNIKKDFIIEKNIKKNTNPSNVITIDYNQKWNYRNYQGPLHIRCSQQQYYNDLSGLIEWYKRRGQSNSAMRNIWLHKAGERLKWLAAQKEETVKSILKLLKNYRALTFCQSIEQSEKLGCPCVNSKIGTENLDKFNSKKVKHIASVDMLTEGLNPVDCKIGLFQMINSSDRITIQRIGRILRHKEPVLIFPYYVYTREQEIINKMLTNYNPELVIRLQVNNINDIKHYL